MPSPRIPTAPGPLYLPPHPEEPDIAGALPTAAALLVFGILLLIFAALVGGAP